MVRLASPLVSIALLLTFAASYGNTRMEPLAVPEALKRELIKYDGMKLVEPKDVSAADCGPTVGSHPGWISGDFTGDGRDDFAVLLFRLKATNNTTFQGQRYSQHQFMLIVFLANNNGAFDSITVRTFSEDLPTIKGLRVEPAGTVFDLDSAKHVRITHPSIAFYSCGQFENVFYWAGSHFGELVTSR